MTEIKLARTLRCAVLSMAVTFALPASAEQAIIGNKDGKDIVTVRVTEAEQSNRPCPFSPASPATPQARSTLPC